MNEIRLFYGLSDPHALELLKVQLNDCCNHPPEVFEQFQLKLAETILNHPILKQFKPAKKFRKSFLKCLINTIEKLNVEVNEIIYENFMNTLNDEGYDDNYDQQEEKYFLVLFNDHDNEEKPIVIEQCRAIITNGTTGLHVWPACYRLIKYLSQHRHLVDGKSILELGSGVGLLGLKCLTSFKPKRFTFTDFHRLVLDQCKRNLDYNNLQIEESASASASAAIELANLDWTNPNESDLFKRSSKLDFDLILATDIIFDPDLMPDLVSTLSKLWEEATNESLQIIISSTIRNQETYNAFIRHLEESKFRHTTLEKDLAPLNNIQLNSLECFIEIIQINKMK